MYEKLINEIETEFKRFTTIPELRNKGGRIGSEVSGIGYTINNGNYFATSEPFALDVYDVDGSSYSFEGTVEDILIRLRAVFLTDNKHLNQ